MAPNIEEDTACYRVNAFKKPYISPDNFRVSLSSMMIGGAPIEPRGGSSWKTAEDPSPTAEPQANTTSDSEEQSDQAASSQDAESSSAARDRLGSNEVSESEDPTSSAKSSTGEGSSSKDNSSVDHKKTKHGKNKGHAKKDDTTSADSTSSGIELASSGDSEHETSSGENTKPKGKAKKKHGKPAKSVSTDKSDATAESADPGDTDSSAATSSAKLDSSEKTDNASTDASTTGAESSQETKSDLSKERDAGPASGISDADASGWSISDDALLRGMKENDDGISWAEIGKSLNRGKNQVKARWKVIKDLPQKTTSGEDETSQAEETSSAPETESGKEAEGSERQANKPNGEAEKREKGAKGKEPEQTKWHTGKRNQKVAAENKTAKSKAIKAKERAPAILSGEEASSESAAADSQVYVSDPEEEERRQDRYMQDHILTEMYPPIIHPQPSNFFDERDCAVLAAVDSKYKRSKWLEMQANFYNVTGKMVPLHVIRAKCEQAEEEEERKKAKRDGVDGRKKVEKWVSSLEGECQEDPMA